MKIDYPEIDWADVQDGDTILLAHSVDESRTDYKEIKIEVKAGYTPWREYTACYLIDRPKPVFPEDYGTVIIAKKVRGIEFPEGVVLTRLRGSNYEYVTYQPMWKSIDRKIGGKDNHGERQIEDWVLAKVVPA